MALTVTPSRGLIAWWVEVPPPFVELPPPPVGGHGSTADVITVCLSHTGQASAGKENGGCERLDGQQKGQQRLLCNLFET